ncbi:hypothetical protein C8J56DRAFT_719140, partial [Mycena floridula]
RSQTMPRRIHNFYYIAIHQGQRIGYWWKHIPECSEWQFCYKCPGTIETLSHILFECESPIQRIIWNLACTLFEKKGGIWPGTSLAMILGCNLLEFKDGSDKRIRRGLTRLFQTLVPLSAHMIWKIRCDIVVKLRDIPSHAETHNKWVHAVNERLQADCLLTSWFRCGPKALPRQVVLDTWSGTLLNEASLPDDWIWNPEVLVGIGPRCIMP